MAERQAFCRGDRDSEEEEEGGGGGETAWDKLKANDEVTPHSDVGFYTRFNRRQI